MVMKVDEGPDWGPACTTVFVEVCNTPGYNSTAPTSVHSYQ